MADAFLKTKRQLFRSLGVTQFDEDWDAKTDEGLSESRDFLQRARKGQQSNTRKSRTPSSQLPDKKARASIKHGNDRPRAGSPQSPMFSGRELQRTVSAPERAPTSSSSNPSTSVVETGNPLRHRFSGAAPIQQTAMPQMPSMPRTGSKRKRAGNIRIVPEDQQVFKSLLFYFFPNNDIDAARRMRITKAIEYGACWIKDWDISVTHIIMDRDLNYSHLLKFLKVETLPAGVILVDQLWPSDCLTYRMLVDPNQVQYKVSGFEAATHSVTRATSEPKSTQSSLALRPPRQQLAKSDDQTAFSAEEGSGKYNSEQGIKLGLAATSRERTTTGQQIPQKSLAPTRQSSFEGIIEEVKALRDLPLDEDDDDDDVSEAQGDIDTDSDLSDSPAHAPKKKVKHRGSWQQNFQCMKSNDGQGDLENPNARTIEVLEQMGRYYDTIQDHWRTLAYRRALGVLKKERRKITTKEEAVLLPFVGERLAAKIEEIVWTDKLQRLDNIQLDPIDAVLQKFLQIYGVGFGPASRWVRQGYRTLEDLLACAHLTDNQRIGILHYEDFLSRIPRDEVTEHGNTVRSALEALDPTFEVIIGGSYRRGAATCGDIDCIITHPAHTLDTIRTIVMESLVPKLFAQRYLKASLAATTSSSKTGSKWHGAAAIASQSGGLSSSGKSSPWRRIDLLLVPPESLGAALLYFTGNDIFNRSIRLLASKKGMRLNQYGLFRDVMRGPERVKVTNGTLVEGRDERKIFEVLGVPWREPHERVC
ncbi:MAG: hypothetical protein M1820_002430 [Bogoriella megaspora]|nr:MAG: hypothetical protein M1820_002430 [Bogoriella megaspora]